MKRFTVLIALLYSFLCITSANAQSQYNAVTLALDQYSLSQNEYQDILSDPQIKTYPNIMNRFYDASDSEEKTNYNIYDRLKTEKSVKEGREFIRDHFAFLNKTERKFDVPKEVVVALIRVETNFGKYTGSYQAAGVFKSIIKFAEAPERISWARDELEALIMLSKWHGIDIYELNSSYAGAFGLPQFMPTSFVQFAEDGNKDGKIDLFHPEDAIWNIGKYLHQHGWKKDPRGSIFAYNHSDKFVDFVMWYAFEALGSVDGVSLSEFNEMVEDLQLTK